jgi:hypothetical protein
MEVLRLTGGGGGRKRCTLVKKLEFSPAHESLRDILGALIHLQGARVAVGPTPQNVLAIVAIITFCFCGYDRKAR